MKRRQILLSALLALVVPSMAFAVYSGMLNFNDVGGVNFQTGYAVGGGSLNTYRLAATPTFNVPSLATTCTDDTFAMTGAALGDYCRVTIGTAATEAYHSQCYIPSADNATIKTCTFGTVNPASQKFFVVIDRLTP